MSPRRACGILAALLLAPAPASADRITIRCDDLSTADLLVDGVLDDWNPHVLGRAGTPGDNRVELRCSWDGRALAVAIDVKDERVIRVRGKGAEDRLELAVSAGGRPLRAVVQPASAIAKSKISPPPRCAVADSLQPKGFSVEARFPASAIPGLSGSTPSLELAVKLVDADLATGGDTTEIELAATVELGDRKDLLDDFLKTVKLRRTDVRLDTLAELDPARRGKERIVAGGTVIGVLTDQFAYVALPAARAADVKQVELVPLGARGQQVVSAVVRQSGNGGSRDVLLLWSVAGGQLQPLAQIEIRKELGANVLESTWKLVKGTKATELWVEPKPAVGFTPDTFNEVPAPDSDAILVPWDRTKRGVAYAMKGSELTRRDLPAKKR